ncbi:hypothetical protein LWI29_006296 [Acer saccharum]|uniref:Neprosin PEP catalytic domain-containing protein n=1 Tax=Acer saccharum TaxID=4024 RepID=A0AA39SWM1_ACESA|nr:hypothetical protein LWI29_006296 [Acer saccharum]
MDPSFLPSVKTNRELLFSSKIPSEGCPMGMVPIQRTQVDNLTDLNSISRLHLGNIQPLTNSAPGRHDKESGNWWLVFDNGIKVGYWPKELFTHMKEGATYIQYGGWTYNSPDGVSPPMGNGHFPDKNFKSSSFVSQMQIVDTFDRLADIDGYFVGNIVDNTNCYNKVFWGNQGSVMGQCMTFGGPGGKCGA